MTVIAYVVVLYYTIIKYMPVIVCDSTVCLSFS